MYNPLFAPQFATDIYQNKLQYVIITGPYYRKYNTNTVSSALRIKTPLAQLSQNIQTVNGDVIRNQASFNTTDGITPFTAGSLNAVYFVKI